MKALFCTRRGKGKEKEEKGRKGNGKSERKEDWKRDGSGNGGRERGYIELREGVMNRKETAEGEMDGEEKGMGKGKRREGGTMLLFPDQKTQFHSI